MITPSRLFACASAGVAALMLIVVWSAFGQSTPRKRAAPPKFDPREVEQVFFPDARKALVGERPTSKSATAPSNAQVRKDGSTRDLPPPASSGGFRWSKLISAETLADEVKVYPPLLAAVLKSPNQFKGNGAKDARRYFSTLAAVFAIAAKYDGDVRWKEQAAAARQLFARAGFNAKSDNENVFNEARLRADDLAALVRGDKIAIPPNIEPQPSFNDQVANRPPLMWRMERAQQDRLAEWTTSASDFNKNLARVKHEAEIVAAFSQVILHASYPDADSEGYVEYAQAVQQAALATRDAVERKDAAAARAAVGNMKRACDNCHADYRGG